MNEVWPHISTILVALVSAFGGAGFWNFMTKKRLADDGAETRLLKMMKEERERTDGKYEKAQDRINQLTGVLFILVAEVQKIDPKSPVIKYALDALTNKPEVDPDGLRRQMEQMRESTASVIDKIKQASED